MRPIFYYLISLACFLLLVFSYTYGITDVMYYPYPGQLPIDDDRNGILFIRGAIETQEEVIRAYELAYGPHAPLNETITRIPSVKEIYAHVNSLFSIIDAPNADETFHSDGITPLPILPGPREVPNRGPLQLIDSRDDTSACSPLEHTQRINNSIVLVSSRGSCSYITQVLNCQAAGAVGVIISGEVSLENLIGDRVNRVSQRLEVPGFVVDAHSFNTLVELAEHNLNNDSDSDEPVEPVEYANLWTVVSYSNESLLEFLFLMISRPIFTMGIVFMIFHGNLERRKRMLRAKPESVEALRTHVWNPECQLQYQQTSCTICLENYEQGCELCVLPCGHEFHKPCVSRWLLNERGVCPLCFHDITKPRETV